MSPDEVPPTEAPRPSGQGRGPGERSVAESAFGARPRSVLDSPVSEHIRLAVLLTALLTAAFAFLLIGINAFRQTGGPARVGAFAPGCPAVGAPKVAQVSPDALASLGGGIASIPARGSRVYEAGMVRAENVWTDNSPTPLSALASRDGLEPAGYEVRWWAKRLDGSEDDDAIDVLQFATAGQAQLFAARAADPRCRRLAASTLALVQPQARTLFWVNPDRAPEWDVIFARGRLVYRAVVVPPTVALTSGSRAERLRENRRARSWAEALACGLPHAGCEFARGGTPA